MRVLSPEEMPTRRLRTRPGRRLTVTARRGSPSVNGTVKLMNSRGGRSHRLSGGLSGTTGKYSRRKCLSRKVSFDKREGKLSESGVVINIRQALKGGKFGRRICGRQKRVRGRGGVSNYRGQAGRGNGDGGCRNSRSAQGVTESGPVVNLARTASRIQNARRRPAAARKCDAR